MALEINNNNNKAACIESLAKSDLGGKKSRYKKYKKKTLQVVLKTEYGQNQHLILSFPLWMQ